MLYVCFCFISLLTPFHMTLIHKPPLGFMAGNCHDCVVLTLCFKTSSGSIKLFSHLSFKCYGMHFPLIVDASGSQIRFGGALCSSIIFYLFVNFFFLNLMFVFSRKSKTKPNGKKPPAEEKKHYLEPEYTKVRVVDFDLKDLVVLPREIDLNEWLASNSE